MTFFSWGSIFPSWSIDKIELDPKSTPERPAFLIHTTKYPGLIRRFFADLPKKETYIGDCTVFHRTSDGRRPGTLAESAMSDALWKWNYERGLRAH